ncbi:transposase, IS630 family [Moritella viscosa]|nr:transposase, IS630 family [Moritella viscosa]CED60700.1 transposase, IS630 family [Moritella viscosa]SHO12198.1 Transposase [Moritella viscosa]
MAGYNSVEKPIIYIDESGFTLDAPREYGYSDKGTRCFGKHDWQPGKRINAIGALLGSKLLTVSLFNGNINSDVFYQWVIDDLLPKIKSPSIIVMDNASFHKRSDIEKAISEQGHQLVFLPPYSPDLNPIEKKWAHAKAVRRKHRCNVDDIFSQHGLRVYFIWLLLYVHTVYHTKIAHVKTICSLFG